MKAKIISVLKWVVRNLLQMTPAGRRIYAQRKARQLQEVQDTLQREGPKILKLVHDAFTKAKIPYYVCDGTLLGLVREGGILPHDIDIDFTILPGGGGYLPRLVYKTAMELGFRFFWAWEYDGQISTIAFDYQGVHIDFDFLWTEGGDWQQLVFTKLDNMKYRRQDDRWSVISTPHPVVKDIREQYIPKYGFTVNMPANYDEYLTSSYGNWRVPDTKWRENNLSVVNPGRTLMPFMGERVAESYFQGTERENCGLCEESVPKGRD